MYEFFQKKVQKYILGKYNYICLSVLIFVYSVYFSTNKVDITDMFTDYSSKIDCKYDINYL